MYFIASRSQTCSKRAPGSSRLSICSTRPSAANAGSQRVKTANSQRNTLQSRELPPTVDSFRAIFPIRAV